MATDVAVARSGVPVTPARVIRAITIAAAATLLVSLICPLIGSAHVDYAKALQGVWPDSEILFGTRIPRVLLALLTGGALAMAGVLFQALFRDALATPYTMGISSGASLGAVLAIVFQVRAFAGMPGMWSMSLLGAGLTLGLVVAIAAEGRRMSSFTLLLAGVTMNSICMAAILLLHNIASYSQSFAIVRWLMGGIDLVDFPTLALLGALVLACAVWLTYKSRQWNLMLIGEDWASARGISPQRLLLAGAFVGSLLTAAVTALTGPIGFVGLIVPHALRLRYGADHRILLPCSLLWGGAFLVLCDTLARTIVPPSEIPVGVITALLGGPWFIYLLRSRRRNLWL